MSFGAFALLSITAVSAGLATVTDKAIKIEAEPRYDVATVIDVDATVMDIREVPRTNPLRGIHLTLKIESEMIDVYLGPVEYLKDFDITFAKGDQIELIGSKVKFESARIVLARQVRRDDSTLYLRNAKGKPYWVE
jgi:hypothetical protein